MKLSLNWLLELLPGLKNFTDKEIISAIEHLGYELEDIKFLGKGLECVRIVKILNIKKHPLADKLQLVEITDGKEIFTVVCGAKNIYVDMVAPYADAGTVLPNGLKIEKRKIREIESNGMLCSQQELLLGDDHSGIMDLGTEFVLGESLKKYVSDTIVEISTPANRFDCLGHVGIVRELAIKFGLNYPPEKMLIEETKNLPFYDLKVENSSICPKYIATSIINLKNDFKLPYFIRHRISVCGLRSINPLVDISNYVLLETGHPVHIFDTEKLEGNKIIVRKAKNGEKILALDGKEYELSLEDIVISDEKNPVAIAGIIGSEKACVSNSTKNILIESALFNREMVRKTRKRLGIITEASYRFERGSGWDMCNYAAFRTVQLVLLYCGGQLNKFIDLKDVQYQQSLKKNLKLNLTFISNLLGIQVFEDDLFRVVKDLGGEIVFAEKQTGDYIIVPPNSRPDWIYQADVAEEIARFKGYEKIPSTFPYIYNSEPEDIKQELFLKQVVNYFVSIGFFQTINYSLCSEEENKLVKNYETDRIIISNPLSKEYSQMRLSLFSGLLRNLITNKNVQTEKLLLFEQGKIYYKRNYKINEEERIGFIITGEKKFISWKNETIKYDKYFIKGVVESLFKKLGVEYKTNYPKLEQKQSMCNLNDDLIERLIEYVIEDKIISFVCEIDKSKIKVKSKYPIFYGELFIDRIAEIIKNNNKHFVELPRYPFVIRDLSLTVGKNIKYEDVVNIIKNFSNNNLSTGEIIEIELFDYYKKDDITNISLSLKFQNREKTLTDEETNKIFFSLINELSKHSIELRK